MRPAMNRLYFRALLLSVCDTGAKLGDGFSERLHQNRQERRLTKLTQHFQRPVLGRCDTSSRSCARTDYLNPRLFSQAWVFPLAPFSSKRFFIALL